MSNQAKIQLSIGMTVGVMLISSIFSVYLFLVATPGKKKYSTQDLLATNHLICDPMGTSAISLSRYLVWTAISD